VIRRVVRDRVKTPIFPIQKWINLLGYLQFEFGIRDPKLQTPKSHEYETALEQFVLGLAEPSMKCQKCAKAATFHITDIVSKGKFRDFHFCDEHARQHLAPSAESSESPPIGALAQQLIAKQPGSKIESSPADKQVCPVCQITFLEFRNSGRLGCPYDYEVFRDELMPLLESIHGETRHSGKVPKRAPRNTQQQTTLIQLRNELKRSIAAEDYETAARIRDKIKGIEQEQGR
jgi:protein arginine kinase activator